VSRIAILGNWHALSNAHQYATALRRLGHEVVTVGPRFTLQDAHGWYLGLLGMAWPPTTHEASEYVDRVFHASPTPDIETEKGERIPWGRNIGYPDAVVSFDAYGETPILEHHPQGVLPCAVVFGDTHTGRLQQQAAEAGAWDHVFVQFRRADLAAFDHPSKHWLPAAADPTIWKPYPEVEKDLDVLFCGSTHPQIHRDRVALIEYLQAQGIDVRVRHAFGEDAARLMARAKVVLNRSLAGDLNMRVPEALMAGASLVTDSVDGLGDLGVNGWFWSYDDRDLADKIVRIALKQWERGAVDPERQHAAAREKLTYEVRAKQLLEVMGITDEPKPHPGPVRERPVIQAAGAPAAARAAAERAPDPEDAARPGAHDREAAPVVTVVIPAFNKWDELTKPLLTHLDALVEFPQQREIIVVDDGSTDATRHIEMLYGGLVRVLHKPNGGFCSAVNYGVRHARGEYVVVLNNDTQPEPGWLDALVDELKHSDCLVGSLILNMDGSVQAAGLEQWPDGTWRNREWIGQAWTGSRHERDADAVMGACFAMRRGTFLRLGGLDESYGSGGCCDVDLAMRARKEGLPVRLRLDSRVRHAEGSTRFHMDGIRHKIAENQARLIERFGNGRAVLDRVGGGAPGGRPAGDALPGPAGGGQAGGRGGGAGGAGRVLTLVWEGHFDPAIGGSLAIVNAEVTRRLTDSLRVVAVRPGDMAAAAVSGVEVADAWLQHYWTPDGWAPVPEWVKHRFLIVPWEAGEPPAAWKEAAADPRLRAVFTPSEHSKRLLSPLFGADRIKVVPNGVDVHTFSPVGDTWDMKAAAYRFLFVGGTTARKGFDLLAAAWRLAFTPDEPVRLVVKRQGASTFYANQSMGIDGLHNARLIDDDLTTDELAALYRSVDCVVAPSRAEGFGMAALEGMASGKPVIVTDQPPFTEFVPKEAGLFVPQDAESLAKCMRWLYEHREEGAAMGKVGREASLAYSWDKVAAQYAAHIREVCNG